VVLYHFGGLAIPESAAKLMGFRGYSRPGQQIVISAAGPAAQLIFAGILIAGLKLSGSALMLNVPVVEYIVRLDTGEQITSLPLQALVIFLLIPSILWALLNLLPVYPLDGGQIARELFTIFSPREGVRNSLILSMVCGIAMALYGFLNGDIFLAILFGLLAYSSYQILQAYTGRGGFGGPW
jgi:membrane-associated protease RseP (regulator of RpoE activity)